MASDLKKNKEYIDSIDFTEVIGKMVNYDGWLREDAEDTCLQYRRFLYLKLKYCLHNNEIFPPSEDIDEFWHAHILDTRAYMRDCQAIFGQYLHHYPYFGIDDDSDKTTLHKAFEITKKLYLQEFGEPLVATRSKYPVVVYYLLKKFFEKPDKKTLERYRIKERPKDLEELHLQGD